MQIKTWSRCQDRWAGRRRGRFTEEKKTPSGTLKNKEKQNRSSGTCCEVEKINNEGLEGFQGTHLQVQRLRPSTTCTCLLSASPANVSLRRGTEDRRLPVFHPRTLQRGILGFLRQAVSVKFEKIHLKKKIYTGRSRF